MLVKNNNLYIDIVESIVEELGFRLVYYKLIVQKKSVKCVIDIHKPCGYISHDDCKLVSRKCYDFLFKEFGDVLSMEVSSPGVNRLLKTEREFITFKGYEVELFFKNDFLKNHNDSRKNNSYLSISNGDVFLLENFIDNCLCVRKIFINKDDKKENKKEDVGRLVSEILLKVNRENVSKIKLLN